MVQMAFCDLFHTYHKQVTNVSPACFCHPTVGNFYVSPNSKDICSRRANSFAHAKHPPVIYKGVHQKALLNDFLVVGALVDEVAVVVVRDHDPVVFGRQLDYVQVIVAHYTLTAHPSRGGEHQTFLLLQLV